MFNNFIFFIVVLLIYTTYQPSESPNFNFPETVFLFFSLIFGFILLTWAHFQKILKQVSQNVISDLDSQYNKTITRLSVIAIVIFTIDIYLLNLTEYTGNIPVLKILPTFQALLFITLFIFYLVIIWNFAFDAYCRIYGSRISRSSYIRSNISFSAPALLPWLILSGIHDLIDVMPFEIPKQFLASDHGQIIFFLTFLVAVAVFGPVLIRRFWGCKPLDEGFSRYRIESLCRRAGLEYSNILYWPIFEGRMITAGVMGLVKKFRYILVTDALLTMLRPEEIEAVIAHEIGHVKKNHLLFYLFFFAGYMLISYAAFDLIIYFIIYAEPVYSFIIQSGFKKSSIISSLFSLITIFMFVIYFRFVFGYFMRNFERQADCYVYSIFQTAMPLISTFEKITITSGQSPDKPNWHHFSISERVGYLLKCEKDRTWIKKQDQKIRKSIYLYVAAMLFIGVIGYTLNFGETGKKFSASFFETIIAREITKNPHDPGLLSLMGDICYEKENIREAIKYYEKSIAFKPDSPKVLNNLAWLYATSNKSDFFNPERALSLALRASELLGEAHVMDTLAESYYVNKRFLEAVKAGEKALELSKTNRSYYEDQLKKFKKAM